MSNLDITHITQVSVDMEHFQAQRLADPESLSEEMRNLITIGGTEEYAGLDPQWRGWWQLEASRWALEQAHDDERAVVSWQVVELGQWIRIWVCFGRRRIREDFAIV